MSLHLCRPILSCALSVRHLLLLLLLLRDLQNTPHPGESRPFPVFVLLLLFASQVPVNGSGIEVQFANGRIIDADTYRASDVVPADLDGDGDQDVVICSFQGDFARWYENEDGKSTFSAADEVSTDVNGPEREDHVQNHDCSPSMLSVHLSA